MESPNKDDTRDEGLAAVSEKSVSEDRNTISKTRTDDHGNNGFPMPAAKRVRTAPAEQSQRPAVGPRASTFRGARRRDTMGARMYDRHNSFEYNFDGSSSDSESSDSSEDEAVAPEATASDAPKHDHHQHDTAPEGRGSNEERRRFVIGNDFFKSKGKVSRKDGRLKISINETANSGYVAKALGQSIRNHLDIPRRGESGVDRHDKKKRYTAEEEGRPLHPKLPRTTSIPKLNIVIMVIGSRGDIQPFIRIAKILKETHGHRVRIASHPVFREFVEGLDLEFFDAGGDPSELMAFMVKNPGLIPNMQTLREGEIGKRRASMAEMFDGFWRACISDDDQEKSSINMRPFIADAIIANPPSMAHVHIAERLGIPLHIMFTFPYTPTTQFPHPLANIKTRKSNVDAGYVNFMSYPLVEMMTWQGLGDIVNRFRENTLRLEPVSSLWAPGALYRMKVPYTYMWSPALVPKPPDWGPEIDLSGFVFLDLAKDYQPSQELTDFLEAGDPPVYIGFGSIVVSDPDKLTDMIFKAVDMAGVRALVSKGWGGFGRDNSNTPKNIFMLGNIPHDWLFPRVKAVVHHGGAGTTAIGLKCAKPTMVVPFFGDQPFWGERIAEARAGAFRCIPYKKLNAERFAEGIKQCLTGEAQANVQKIADSICKEGDGAENAVDSFHSSLPLSGRHSLRCSILENRVAVWRVKKSSLRLSALAAQLLHQQGKFKWEELKLLHHYAWNDFDGPGEPVTGTIGALSDSLYGIGEGFGMVPIRIARHIRKREEHERKKRERQKRRQGHKPKKPEQDITAPSKPKGEHPGTVRANTNLTLTSTISADPAEPLSMEMIEDLHWGLRRAGAAALTMPNDLHVAIAQGLHNAPRLWGDATIRKPVRIKGLKSGWTAARKEFAYGIYDGWTGLVKQPKGDWQDGETVTSKFAGLGTGIGKGLGGFVLKNVSAVSAPPAYVVKGLIKHVEKRHDGPGCKAWIRRSRVIQGERDLHKLQNDANDTDGKELEVIKRRVEKGWAVYEKIWNAAQKHFGPVGGSVVAKYRMKKEKERWDVNGALENVDTADRAIKAYEQGANIDHLFEKQEEERRRERKSSKASRKVSESRQSPAKAELGHKAGDCSAPKYSTSLPIGTKANSDGMSAAQANTGHDQTVAMDDIPLHMKRVSTVA